MLFDLILVATALPIEAVFGYPDALFRQIGHPVTWIGGLIAWLDGRLNGGRRQRLAGVATVAVIVLAAGLPAWALQAALLHWLPLPWAVIVLAAATSSLLAQNSLWRHVKAVQLGLEAGLVEGRAAVGHIVGRDTQSLDEAGVARAAIESLAENFSDGVVAPALWCALLGLPGIAVYKAINTADSMIGHWTPRHAAFGWAAARLDDLVNLPASRLAAILLLAAACLHGDASGAVRAVLRDAGRHRSPNAGWPEAAMAGALGLRLAGPRVYGAERVDDAWMGDGSSDASPAGIVRALKLFRTACMIGFAGMAGLGIVLAGRT